MNRLELLKKAKEKVDELVAQKQTEQQEDELDSEAAKMAIESQRHDSLVSAIEESRVNMDDLAERVAQAVAQVSVNVPPISVPAIQIPEIKVPEAKVTVNIPEIKLPDINVPEPKVTVNVPEVKIPPFPEIKMPDSMEIHGDVSLFGYGFDNPLPVQLRDAQGNPVSLPDMLSVVSGGGGPRYVKINNTESEPIPITGNITSTPGATYYASDAIGSVNIVQSIPIDVTVVGATGTIGVVTINPDGNPVYGGTSSGGGLTDAELRAASIDVQQASGASWSTAVLSMPAVVVTSITNSTASALVDSLGVQYSGSNPVPVQASIPGVATIGDGLGSVTTAGTAVNVATNACKRVIVFNNTSNADLTNGGIIVVGTSTVVATEATRRGALIYPGNSMSFNVSNTNLLYIDATDNGAKYHFYYEN